VSGGVRFDGQPADLCAVARKPADVLAPEYLCPRDVSRHHLEESVAQPGAETALDAVLRLDVHGMLMDDPVQRVDSMTMAWGLEARVPFLDQDLVTPWQLAVPEMWLQTHGIAA
jgi:asparagine synthase (glutamine-hydrolysing)